MNDMYVWNCPPNRKPQMPYAGVNIQDKSKRKRERERERDETKYKDKDKQQTANRPLFNF
jgi:hypothetical protein